MAVAAATALVVGTLTILQKMLSDARAEWWRRAQWALDLALGEDEAQAKVGFAVLDRLYDSTLAKAEEIALLTTVWSSRVGDDERDNGGFLFEE